MVLTWRITELAFLELHLDSCSLPLKIFLTDTIISYKKVLSVNSLR